MMNVDFLTKNDLVLWDHPRKGWIVIKVTLKILRTATDSEIKPIDLTPEILENNGFTKRDAIPGVVSWKEWVSKDGRVILTNNPDHINSENTWSIHVDSKDMATICTAELSYLHELQHILRHCKIEHEFKKL